MNGAVEWGACNVDFTHIAEPRIGQQSNRYAGTFPAGYNWARLVERPLGEGRTPAGAGSRR